MEKKITKKYNVRTKSSAQENKMSEEKLDVKCNKGNGNLKIILFPAKLPICEKELKESLSSEGNINNRKLRQMYLKEGSKF